MVRGKGKRVAILIVGTHRSGAALLARVLELLGCDLPKADATGESGHRKAAHAIALNDRLLASAGTVWDDWAALDTKWSDSCSANEFHALAQAMLQVEFATSKLFVLEDSRTCRLLPFWTGALEAFGAEPRVVSMLHDPLDASLEARDEIDSLASHLLWLRHALDAEAASRGFKCAWLRYETLLAGPQAAMNALGNALDLSWPKRADRDVWIEIEGLLCHERRHRRSDDSRMLENPTLSHWLGSSFEILERWGRGEERPEDIGTLDQIRSAFDAAVPMFHRVLAAHGEQIEALHRQVAEYESEIKRLRGSGDRRPGRAGRRVVGRVRASTAMSLHRVARRLFFAAPLPPALQYRLLRRYHRYMASRRAGSSRGDGFFALEEDRGGRKQCALPVPHDGRWSPEAFAKHCGALRSLAAALASPEEDGPLHEGDIDIEPVREGPLVTIVVRSYAGRWPLAKVALESITAQSYRPIEVVVAEDGPGDMAAMIDSLDGRGCQFRHVATGIKAGRSAAANLGLAHANGTFVGFLDDDDRLMEHHCGTLVSCLLKAAHVDAAYAASEEVEARYDETHSRMDDNGNISVFFKPMASSSMLFSDNFFPIQTVLFRRLLLSPASRFDEKLDALEDWLFWMRVLPGRRVAPVAEITSRFHVPYGDALARRQRLHRLAEDYLDIQRRALWVFHRFTSMDLIDEHANYLMHRAWQRARLPMVKGGGKHSDSSNEETPLERALGAASSRPSPTAPKFDRKVVAYTSVNLRYLPKALAWAKSVKRHSPDWETHILLNDAPPDSASFWPNVDRVYAICNLDVSSLHSWIFTHDVVELCTATKPFYAKHLLDSGYDYVFYLDPDTHVYSDLDILLDEMEECDILLTPHSLADAIQDSEIHYNEMSSLAHGIFNLGFIGFKQSPAAHAVANFWKRRLLTHCTKEHARGLWTDQKWFNLVPFYFDNVNICKHKGCNTASWNIAHRTISRKNDQWLAGGEPLIFFHFSGYDRHTPRTMFDIFGGFNEDLEHLITEYDDIINGFYSSHKEWKSTWIYGYYDNGEEVLDSHREYYRNRWENVLTFPQPFYTRGDRSWLKYVKWLGYDHLSEWTDSATRLKRYY